MKVALVHDYLIDYGGAERVLSALHELFPSAPIYVAVYRKGKLGSFKKEFEKAEVKQSWFGFLPFADYLISPFRFLLPLIWSGFNFSKYDLVITSASWAVTKGMRKGKKTEEICYLHAPPRYLYGYDTSRKWRDKWYGKLIDLYALIVNHFMRQYDFKSAQKVDYFIVNSKNVGKRVEKFYRRTDYQVIYPPVNVQEIIDSQVEPVQGDYFLTGGRLVASKNFDLIIQACKKAKVHLKIFGLGPEEKKLKQLANERIEFLGRISDQELISLYRGARAFILAQEDEDFGMTPIEANAAGCPVIAFKGGGYLETVIDGKNGIFFDHLTRDSLVKAIKKIKKTEINSRDCINQSKKFSRERFKKEIREFIKKTSK